MPAKHLIISGKVQGVWYRRSFANRASELNLSGWVRNLENGDVEAFVQGEQELLDDIIAYAHKGPPLASVSGVAVSDVPVDDSLADTFEVRR